MSKTNGAHPPGQDGPDRLIHQRSAYDRSWISNELDAMGLSPSAFRVYCNLLRRADKHYTCYPGGKKIAEDCQLNRETVIKALRELEKRGMLKVNRTWGKSSDYELLPLAEWKDQNGKPKYPPVPKTDMSEKPTSRKEEKGLSEKPTRHVGFRNTNPINVTLPKEDEDDAPARAHARAYAPAREAKPPAVVVVSFCEAFRLSRKQAGEVQRFFEREGEAYLQEKAAIARKQPNPAACFMRALREDWKASPGPENRKRKAKAAPQPEPQPAAPEPDYSPERHWWANASPEQRHAVLARPEVGLLPKPKGDNPSKLFLEALRHLGVANATPAAA